MHDVQHIKIASQETLAFHFQYILPGEWIDQFELATALFTRILRVVQRDIPLTGNLLFRMGHLLSAVDIGSGVEISLRQSIASTHVDRFIAGRQKSPKHFDVSPDHIWVVVLSGRALRFQADWSRRLRRYAKHPFLFSLAIDLSDPAQELSYFGNTSVLGELHADWSFNSEFTAVEYEPHLQNSFDRLNVKTTWSKVAGETGLRML